MPQLWDPAVTPKPKRRKVKHKLNKTFQSLVLRFLIAILKNATRQSPSTKEAELIRNAEDEILKLEN
jgi:hypothetical protein